MRIETQAEQFPQRTAEEQRRIAQGQRDLRAAGWPEYSVPGVEPERE